jgi:hypothetical protein
VVAGQRPDLADQRAEVRHRRGPIGDRTDHAGGLRYPVVDDGWLVNAGEVVAVFACQAEPEIPVLDGWPLRVQAGGVGPPEDCGVHGEQIARLQQQRIEPDIPMAVVAETEFQRRQREFTTSLLYLERRQDIEVV